MDCMAISRQALGTLRRQRVCEWVELEELLSVGHVAIVESGVRDEALAVVIARRAMCKAVDRNRVRQAGRVWINREGSSPERNWEEMSDGDAFDAVVYGKQHLQPINTHPDLWEAMKALPAREYRVISLTFWGGKSQADIAAELGVSQQRVAQILASAKNNLRSALVSEDSQRMTKVRGEEAPRGVLSGATEAA